jgi:putative membrane protein
MQSVAVPYCGSAPDPAQLAARWNFDPLLIAVLLAAWLFLRMTGARNVPLVWGFAALIVLFISPLCALTSSLFSARVVHHLLLTAVAAPLIAAALPRARGNLAAWTAGHAVIFWAWHAPSAYAFGLASDAGYWFMQASLLVSAIGFWRAVLAAPAPAGVAALLATMTQMGLLGALLTFAGRPLYAWHIATTQPWGLSPLEDQQLAGLVMWVPGAGFYLFAALWLANGWFGERRRLAAV